jgi:tetratricopeptide (TPR) repeat protein
MLTEPLESKPHEIEVEPRPIPVIVSGTGFEPLAIEFPPVEELRHLREIASEQVSFRAVAEESLPRIQEAFREAALRAEQGEHRFAHSATYLSKLADLYFLGGQSEKAQELNRLALERSKSGVFTIKVAGDLVRAGDLRGADKMLANSKDLPLEEALARRASIAAVTGDRALAISLLESAIAANPASTVARYLLGVVSLASGRFEIAVRNLRVAADDLTTSSAVLVNLAIAYVCLGKEEKAIAALRRASAINPLDENAVAVLADLSFGRHESAVAIRPLQEFLRYEQTSAAMWARLARAYYSLQEYESADRALKQQSAVCESPSAWNNRGVVASVRGHTDTAWRYFKRALELSSLDAANWLIPATNLASLLVHSGNYQDAVDFTESIIAQLANPGYKKDESYAPLFLLNLSALAKSRHYDTFLERSSQILSSPHSSRRLQIGVLTDLTYYFTLREPEVERAVGFARQALELVGESKEWEAEALKRLLNNAAYAFIEAEQFGDARAALSGVSGWVHRDIYVTATAGFYHLRKGNWERGESLYRNAMILAADSETRKILAQKLDLELGRLSAVRGNVREAVRRLRKAVSAKSGLAIFSDSARRELLAIQSKK